MTVAEDILQNRLVPLRALCERFRVRKLELFGSATTERFDPDTSDFDFLYEFDDPSSADLADRYFGLWEELQRLFGRKIDLIDPATIENPYLLRKVNSQRRTVYAA